MLGAGIRAVYAKAAALPGCRPRESMLRGRAARPGRGRSIGPTRSTSPPTLRTLADRLSEYCGDGTYAYLFDRETTVPHDARLVVFDTRRCPETELRLVEVPS